MPKFKVCAHQYVERIVTLDIEAETPEEARDIALRSGIAAAPDEAWEAGDDAYSPAVYAILDEASENVLWEP
jgi:O-succinylbenzoate synthase